MQQTTPPAQGIEKTSQGPPAQQAPKQTKYETISRRRTCYDGDKCGTRARVRGTEWCVQAKKRTIKSGLGGGSGRAKVTLMIEDNARIKVSAGDQLPSREHIQRARAGKQHAPRLLHETQRRYYKIVCSQEWRRRVLRFFLFWSSTVYLSFVTTNVNVRDAHSVD